MKDELGEKIMIKFARLRAKTYSYLADDCGENKKGKDTKTCAIKKKLKFENYKNCLEATQLENKTTIQKKMKLTQIILKKTIKNS